MSEMVERVAKAIFECAEKQLIAAGISTEMTPDDFKYEARAAIEAMREPTQAMIVAWKSHLVPGMIIEDAFRNYAWPSAIDAALKE